MSSEQNISWASGRPVCQGEFVGHFRGVKITVINYFRNGVRVVTPTRTFDSSPRKNLAEALSTLAGLLREAKKHVSAQLDIASTI